MSLRRRGGPVDVADDNGGVPARRAVIRWIEGWFNARRLHSSNDYNSPIDWENLYYRRGDGIAA